MGYEVDVLLMVRMGQEDFTHRRPSRGVGVMNTRSFAVW